MRRSLLLVLAAMALAVVGPSILTPQSTPLTVPAVAAQQRVAQASPCTVAFNKVAAPAVVPLGYSADVTLTARVLCPATAPIPLHMVLVLDTSGSMEGDKNLQLKKAAKSLIADLQLRDHPEVQMGIVSYNSLAETLCPLGNDTGRLVACVNHLSANGASAIDKGIREGLKVLTAGRDRGAKPGDIREVMVVLTDGANNADCAPVLQAAGQTKAQQVLLTTICLGGDCDENCMRQAASSPHYFFLTDGADGLAGVFNTIRKVVTANAVTLTVTDTLPPNMAFVKDSDSPPLSPPSPDPRTWQFFVAPPGAVTMTFKVTPLELGDHPTNVEAKGHLVDANYLTLDFTFPVPHVRVVDSTGLPTATPYPTRIPPTVTPTPLIPPSPSATSTNGPPPPTATPLPPMPKVCPNLSSIVPMAAIADALANPGRVAGWGQRCQPGKPAGPFNPLRTWLGLQRPGTPYNPLFNGLAYKCGCS